MVTETKPHHLGIYRHYKGDLFMVIGECVHHDTRAAMVLYRSHKTGVVNCRPLHGSEGDPDGWLVPVDGKPRFEFVGMLPPDEVEG